MKLGAPSPSSSNDATSACTWIEMLAQADVFFLLAQVFSPNRSREVYPNELARPSEIGELLCRTGWEKRDYLSAQAQEWLDIQAIEPTTGWITEYHRLFEGAMPCPLNETAYIRRDKGVLIGDLCGFYRAFGFVPRNGSGEKPDHLCHELQFLAVLLVMMAQAEQSADAERVAVTREAMVDFAANHLGDWLPLLANHIHEVTSSESFRRASRLLEAVWQAFVTHWKIPITALDPVLPPGIGGEAGREDLWDEAPFQSCGFEDTSSPVQIQANINNNSNRREI